MTQEKRYTAIVQQVYPNGAHGPYAKARSEKLGSVTFSLLRDVWKEKKRPDEGARVLLTQIRGKSAGWRAESARFLRPDDPEGAEVTVATANPDERK